MRSEKLLKLLLMSEKQLDFKQKAANYVHIRKNFVYISDNQKSFKIKHDFNIEQNQIFYDFKILKETLQKDSFKNAKIFYSQNNNCLVINELFLTGINIENPYSKIDFTIVNKFDCSVDTNILLKLKKLIDKEKFVYYHKDFLYATNGYVLSFFRNVSIKDISFPVYFSFDVLKFIPKNKYQRFEVLHTSNNQQYISFINDEIIYGCYSNLPQHPLNFKVVVQNIEFLGEEYFNKFEYILNLFINKKSLKRKLEDYSEKEFSLILHDGYCYFNEINDDNVLSSRTKVIKGRLPNCRKITIQKEQFDLINYFNDNLDINYQFEIKENHLVLINNNTVIMTPKV